MSSTQQYRVLHKNALMTNFSCQKNKEPTEAFMQNVRHFCPILTKFRFTRQIIIETPYSQLHANPSNGSSTDILGPTDRNGKANKEFSRLCESSLNDARFLHGPIRANKIFVQIFVCLQLRYMYLLQCMSRYSSDVQGNR